jgi:hypothetical protein
MNQNKLFLATLATVCISGAAIAQTELHSALPPAMQAKTVQIASASMDKGPAGNVDKVLEQISRNMQPAPDMIDAQAETAINRDMNLSRSTGQMLRPVGFMQIENERVIFASEDGVRVLRLKENSRLGLMKISKISEFGVEYTVSGKTMYAPLAYTASEAPKAGQVINLPIQQTTAAASNSGAGAIPPHQSAR